jgi:hypothetical protein
MDEQHRLAGAGSRLLIDIGKVETFMTEGLHVPVR